MTSTIELTEPSPGVRVVTLSRPEAANALNTAMGEELLALLGRQRIPCGVGGIEFDEVVRHGFLLCGYARLRWAR